ncbi:AMP-binding protein [Microvirga sp. P5_D2]
MIATQSSTTLPSLLIERAAQTPNAVAIQFKKKGVWHALSWNEYLSRVQRCALGLSRLGFGGGDRLLLIGEACPEWLIADLAAQWLGGISVTPYPDGSEHDIVSSVEAVRPRLAIVDRLDRKIALEAQSIETLWLRSEPGNSGQSVEDMAAGDPIGTSHVQNSIATIAFTAGAGGVCRPIRLSHADIIARAKQVSVVLSQGQTTGVFCQVPFAHLAERVASAVPHLLTGGTLYFGERIDTVSIDLRDIAVDRVSALAWQWNHLAQSLILKMQDASPRDLTRFRNLLGGKSGRVTGWMMRMALRRHLGLHRVKQLVCHSAEVKPETDRFFAAIELPLLTGYGITEACGWSMVKVGEGPWASISGQRYDLARDGQVRLWTDDMPLETGDLALEEGGHFQLLGRREGNDVSVSQHVLRAERDIRQSPYIAHAALLQHGSNLRLIAAIDPLTVGDWARRHGHSYTSFRSLASHPETQLFVISEVSRIIARHMPNGVHTDVIILQDQASREEGTLTATGNMRRESFIRDIAFSDLPSRMEMRDAVSG